MLGALAGERKCCRGEEEGKPRDGSSFSKHARNNEAIMMIVAVVIHACCLSRLYSGFSSVFRFAPVLT